jgi:hypothetical protein
MIVMSTDETRPTSKELVVDVSFAGGCEQAAARIAKKHLGGVYRLRMVQVVDTYTGRYVRLNFEPSSNEVDPRG